MAYIGKKEKMGKELLDFFEKKPFLSQTELTRLEAEMQIKYGFNKQTIHEMMDAFKTTGRLSIIEG